MFEMLLPIQEKEAVACICTVSLGFRGHIRAEGIRLGVRLVGGFKSMCLNEVPRD